MQTERGEAAQVVNVYPEDYRAAAMRNWRDAEVLKHVAAFANCGYHYGFAAECAVKRRFRAEQACPTVRPTGVAPAKDFRRTALLRLSGRRSGALVGLLRNPEYFRGWAVEMRYSRDADVDEASCTKWRQDALFTMRAAEIRW